MTTERVHSNDCAIAVNARHGCTCVSERETQLELEVARLRETLPSAHKLRLLAGLFDKAFPDDLNPEIQTDLRKWASKIEAISTPSPDPSPVLRLAAAALRLLPSDVKGHYCFTDCDGDCQGRDCFTKVRSGETVHHPNCEVGELLDAVDRITPEDRALLEGIK